jgi:type IV pilus assembly protein PilB
VHIKEEKLKAILLDSGLIDDKLFTSAKEEAFRSGQEVTDVLIGREEITEDYLAELLQPYFGVPTVNLKKISIPQEVLFLLPESLAKTKNIVLFDFNKETMTAKLAMLDPLDLDTVEYVRAMLDAWVEPYLTTQNYLRYGLKQYKKKIGMEFNQIIEENIKKSFNLAGETDLSKMAEAVPIITILDSIIENAVVLGASDIHFEQLTKKLLVRYRVDGIMQEILSMPKIISPILVARVKILANMQIDEHRVPQDGRFHFDMEEGGKIDIRVNVMPVLNGEKVEMRLLKSSSRPLSLNELGLEDTEVSIIIDEIKKPHGMTLITGPTGHGKTTTLYSILHILNTPKVNITTIEDPIEYEVARINQTQVNQKAGITFANGLRSLMRQNPDIIMIGEIRDNETVDIAIHAALTGHLVLSSLHTNDAPSAIPRLLDMGAQGFLLASTLNLVIAQRLVRKICSACVESYKPAPRIKAMIKEQYAISAGHRKIDAKIPEMLFHGKGCKVCGGSGFSGQFGIFEIFRLSEAIRKLITESASAGKIKEQAMAEGMISMFEDGMKKVEKGITTIEEVLRVVKE